MDDFQAATDRFLAWFKSVGGEFRDDLIEIKDLRSRDAGRGIIAIKDIPEETTLFIIPRDAIINVQTSALPRLLPRPFDRSRDEADEYDEPLDPWSSLILVMMYEFLQGQASRWKPYLDVLPETFDTPIFWTESELRELEGTCLTPEKIGKQESDDMIRLRILPLILQNPSMFYARGARHLPEDELLRLAHRMGSTIMAYAFDLTDEPEQSEDEEEGWVEDREDQVMLGMVPMADILNANADFNAHVNHGENLEVNSLRSNIVSGSEILNYYGPLPSSELLRRYGYVTPEHRCYDVAEIAWSLVRSSLCSHLGLADNEMDEIEAKFDEDVLEDYFLIERDSGEPSSEGRLTYPAELLEISPVLEDQMTAVLKEIKKLRPGFIPDKRKRDEVYDTIITTALKAKFGQYPTTLEEDEALLQQGDLSKRHRMAVSVRLGEKHLLREGLALRSKGAGAPPDPDDPNEESVMKRAKH
ncbi:SET domain-containing protein RMS1 [Cucurbitaria berberidis CBS 394.84]|uniref:SET domain-containing protein RMS1 n=1 Tax=Cucurbitaria berberidis CBS 394.84 TaxID=1168544 RepID=A0A9P4GBA3_9PLEO|nr:SET domain-containing protein RMS1 [Cucurbitaria berberidis CBS 394.84]KAF1842277.1 SET domain-containing protein RMS1 [Cucurbitaria berberidis CBS 394.84]